jgi:hypothetical protein
MIQILTGRTAKAFNFLSDQALKGHPTSPPPRFLNSIPFRHELWDIIFTCLPSLIYMRTNINTVVARLAALVASRMADSSQAVWSVPTAPTLALPELSAEIKRIGGLPITGGGFCDIWLGERLGKQKVALKILKMFGVPDQIRRVRGTSLSLPLGVALIEA